MQLCSVLSVLKIQCDLMGDGKILSFIEVKGSGNLCYVEQLFYFAYWKFVVFSYSLEVFLWWIVRYIQLGIEHSSDMWTYARTNMQGLVHDLCLQTLLLQWWKCHNKKCHNFYNSNDCPLILSIIKNVRLAV